MSIKETLHELKEALHELKTKCPGYISMRHKLGLTIDPAAGKLMDQAITRAIQKCKDFETIDEFFAASNELVACLIAEVELFRVRQKTRGKPPLGRLDQIIVLHDEMVRMLEMLEMCDKVLRQYKNGPAKIDD
jgi:hypothetical protein